MATWVGVDDRGGLRSDSWDLSGGVDSHLIDNSSGDLSWDLDGSGGGDFSCGGDLSWDLDGSGGGDLSGDGESLVSVGESWNLSLDLEVHVVIDGLADLSWDIDDVGPDGGDWDLSGDLSWDLHVDGEGLFVEDSSVDFPINGVVLVHEVGLGVWDGNSVVLSVLMSVIRGVSRDAGWGVR